jgi:Ca-activated chloride channel family protein
LSFEWPLALVALVAIPVLVAAYVVFERRRARYAARFTNPALLPNLVDARPGVLRHLPPVLLLVALAAMIVGVARPHATVTVRRQEATIVLAIDSSISMRARDVKPSRLAAARAAALAFVNRVPKTFRVGFVSFSGRPYVILPPTLDRDLAAHAVAALRPGSGTALGDAVRLAVTVGERRRPGDTSVPPVAVLVISDGAQKSGRTTPEAAAQLARARGVPVYGIVVGTPNGTVEVRLTGGYKQQIRVPVDASTLRQLARDSGGELFTATNDARLRDVYERLASRLGHRRTSREISDVFAGGSAALLLLGGALSAFLFRRVP